MAELAAKNGAEALEGGALGRWIDSLEIDAERGDREKIDLVKFVLDRVGLAVLRAMTTGGYRVDTPSTSTDKERDHG